MPGYFAMPLIHSTSKMVTTIKFSIRCSKNIFNRVNLGVVVFFLIMPSAILFMERNSLLGFPCPVESRLRRVRKAKFNWAGILYPPEPFFNGLICMAAEGSAVRQILGVINGSRSESGSENKAVINVNRSMFFKTVMRLIVFNSPVRFEVS